MRLSERRRRAHDCAQRDVSVACLLDVANYARTRGYELEWLQRGRTSSGRRRCQLQLNSDPPWGRAVKVKFTYHQVFPVSVRLSLGLKRLLWRALRDPA
jgi:hypothetical protein